ncbi:uncharacterized protein LOC124160120 [Ischnura elegans]|uniref:uncharacterized protein LOC124160120 n=1 Tax=Ischnura elegans TaxID=197161 RepID=UPI001ED86A64|nr:uncharacterized protein LOC124160120 [Ischnura elegans]
MMHKLKGDMVSLTNAASTSRKANRTGNSSSCSSSGSLINNQCTTTNAPASVSHSSVSGDPQHDIGDEEGFMNFGGRLVEKERVARVDKSRGISFFTSNIMAVVFYKEEMAKSSITGGECNLNKKKGEGTKSNKVLLNVDVRKSVEEFIMGQLSITPAMINEVKAIQAAMKAKLNNESTAWKKRTE